MKSHSLLNVISAAKSFAARLLSPVSSTLVLIVDDEPEVLRVTDLILRREGYHTLTASNGREALAFLREYPVDLLVTDVHMPEMNGEELVAQAREMIPDLNVMYLTGHADRLFRHRSRLGASEALVSKPFNLETLRKTLSGLLAGNLQDSVPSHSYAASGR